MHKARLGDRFERGNEVGDDDDTDGGESGYDADDEAWARRRIKSETRSKLRIYFLSLCMQRISWNFLEHLERSESGRERVGTIVARKASQWLDLIQIFELIIVYCNRLLSTTSGYRLEPNSLNNHCVT